MSKDDKNPSDIFIDDFNGNVYQLKKKIKEELKPKLDHLAAVDLNIYELGTAVPIQEGVVPIDPQTPIEEVDLPQLRGEFLIVMPKEQQQMLQVRPKQCDGCCRYVLVRHQEPLVDRTLWRWDVLVDR